MASSNTSRNDNDNTGGTGETEKSPPDQRNTDTIVESGTPSAAMQDVLSKFDELSLDEIRTLQMKCDLHIASEANTFPQIMTEIPEFKLAVLGCGGVGKTSFIEKLWGGKFESNHVVTIEAKVYPVVINTNRGPLKFNMWDSVGQQVGGEVNRSAVVGANCGILMYDLTSRVTASNLLVWRRFIHNVTNNKDIPIVVVGNKCDRPHGRPFSGDDDYYRGMRHILTSAKQSINLSDTLLIIAQQLSGDKSLHLVEEQPPLSDEKEPRSDDAVE